ncbi:MAG: PAS domain S-box protein, partial [Methanoregula sp.]|nr:PAS domain S-box protein [Methanoregula sp.]
KRAEEGLRESQETFRSLVEGSTDGVVLVDESGKVIAFNHALGKICGISPDEALGMSYFDLMVRTIIPEHRNPEQIAAIKKEIDTMFRTGKSPFFSSGMETEICRTDGTRRKIQQTVFPIKTAKGFRIGSIIRDITDQKGS